MKKALLICFMGGAFTLTGGINHQLKCLAPMSREVALKKLEALAKGAALARERV